MKSRDELGRFLKGHKIKRPSLPSGENNKRWLRVKKECPICSKSFWVKKCRVKEKNYCSTHCSSLGFRGTIAWNKGLGTKSKENELFRKSAAYKRWRESIFERDNYTCIWCKQKGGKLNADHIKPFAIFKDLRLSLNNGRTLCESCHKKTETYGGNSKIYGKKEDCTYLARCN